MKINLKKVMILVMAVLVGLSTFTGCTKKEEKTKDGYAKELNLYIWSEYIPDTVIQQFEDKYGIKVNINFYASMDEMLSKLQAGDYKKYDLIQPYNSEMEALISQDYIQKINYDNIPNMKYIDTNYLHQDYDKKQEYTVPYVAGGIYICYNKTTCPIEIKSISDLADPALKDSIVSITSSRDVMGLVLDSLGYDPNTTEEAQIAEAAKVLNSIKPNIKVFDGDAPRKELLNGECSIAITYSQDFAMAQQEKGDDYVIADIDSGYEKVVSQFCVTKKAKHAREAELFIDFIQDPKVMASILDVYPNGSVNTEALKYTSDKYNKYNGMDFTEEQKAKLWFSVDVGEATSIYDKYWSEFMNQ